MKRGWEKTRLGKICSFDKIQGIYQNLPYVGLENIESNTARFIGSLDTQQVKSSTFKFSDQHILYGRLRPYLNKVLAPDFDGHCSTEIFPIKPRKNIIREFLLYWFLSDETVNRINETCTGSRMPRADMKEVLGFEISVPPLPEQRRIVAILDEAFADIAAAKEKAEQNLKNAKEVFEALLQDTFLNHSDNWEEKPIKRIGITQTGITPHTSDKENYGDYIPFVKPADIDIDGFGAINYSNFGLSKKGLSKGRLIKKNSVLMVCIGASIGKTGFSEQEISCNQQINSLTVNKNLEPKFFYYALKRKSFFDKVILNSAQATLPIINKSKWENISVKYPRSVAEQRQIVAQLDSLSAETSLLESLYQQKLSDLEELKKSVLQQAFSGAL